MAAMAISLLRYSNMGCLPMPREYPKAAVVYFVLECYQEMAEYCHY